MANFAFAVDFQPGQGPDASKLQENVFKKLFPNYEPNQSTPEIVGVRRLFYECYSNAAIDLTRRMDEVLGT